MLSFVDTRILLLLAVTSFLASCQCKFDYLLFFSVMDRFFFFSGSLLQDLCDWCFYFLGETYVKVNLKTLNWIELMQRIIRFSSRIRLS